MGLGNHPLEISVPGFILRQQNQVVGLGAAGAGPAFVHASVRHVDFAAQDRLYARAPGFLVEIDHAVKNSVIGDCGGGHAQLGRL